MVAEMTISGKDYKDRILKHYTVNWQVNGREIVFTKGPVHELPPEFAIVEFAPHAGREMWTYATCCMSQEDDTLPTELHMFSPIQNEKIVELLVATAHYHRTGHRIGLGNSVNFGRPWLDNSACEYGFVSLPYLDGPKLENLALSRDKTLKMYWLIPVTKSEVEYKKVHGVDGLEELFETGSLNYIDVTRKSLC